MERRYGECNNQSRITLGCDMAFQAIRTQESNHVIKANNIDQSCVFSHFSTRNLCKDIINIRPTSKDAHKGSSINPRIRLGFSLWAELYMGPALRLILGLILRLILYLVLPSQLVLCILIEDLSGYKVYVPIKWLSIHAPRNQLQ